MSKSLLTHLILVLPFLTAACGRETKETYFLADYEQATVAIAISEGTVEVLSDADSEEASGILEGPDMGLLRKYCRFSVKKGTYSLQEVSGPYVLSRTKNDTDADSLLDKLILNANLEAGAKAEALAGGTIVPYEKSDEDRSEKIASIENPILEIGSDGKTMKVKRTCALWKTSK